MVLKHFFKTQMICVKLLKYNYNPSRKQTVLIVFHDVIADMISNKKLMQ